MNEQQHHSDYLKHTRKIDTFVAESQDALATPGLTYLRLELVRMRVGMGDYLMKVSTPKLSSDAKSNTVLTLRGSRRQASANGALGTAKVIIREMEKNGDKTADWTKVNPDHLARMIAPSLKFFSQNTASEQLQFSTEALA